MGSYSSTLVVRIQRRLQDIRKGFTRLGRNQIEARGTTSKQRLVNTPGRKITEPNLNPQNSGKPPKSMRSPSQSTNQPLLHQLMSHNLLNPVNAINNASSVRIPLVPWFGNTLTQ